MARRRGGENFIVALYELGSLLPWWICVPLALFVYVFLHGYAQSDPVVAADPRQALDTLLPNVLRHVAVYAQYGVPAILLAGALASAFRAARRSHLFASVLRKHATDDLDSLTWREFEDVVHELFRKQGYSVVQTEAGPDGGIDLKLKKHGRLSTVQCKHWSDRKVDVKVVREQLGVMTAAGADDCFVVTTGDYTAAAEQFARGQPVTLIDGALLRMHLATLAGHPEGDLPPADAAKRLCPTCNAPMARRTAKRGAHAGSEFWGCTRFPVCRGTRA